MNVLNIIDTIYESKYFPTILLISIIILVVLFIAVIILGLRDSKKSKNPKKENLMDVKDITFEKIPEKEAIKEDVTFEIPVLTQNLENFKKSLEEEIDREEKVNVIKKVSDTKEETKKTKILDKEKIENTAVMPIINIDTIEEPVKEEVVEEAPHPPKREILKELLKDRKTKEIEPPRLKEELKEEPKKIELPTKKEQPQIEVLEVEIPKKNETKTILKKEIINQEELPTIKKDPTPVKRETKYSGDDDF